MDRYEDRQRANDPDRAAQMEAGKPSRGPDTPTTHDEPGHGHATNQRDPDEHRSGNMEAGKPHKG